MYHPDRPLFGGAPPHVVHIHLYTREDGYVDLVTQVSPALSIDVLERATYARLTLSEAVDVITAQAELLLAEESPS